MFQMIVAVVSIALVALLAIAAIYYGGVAFTGGAEKAEFAQYQNEGVQISSALKVHEAMTGVSSTNFRDLGPTDRHATYNFNKLVEMEILKDDSLAVSSGGSNPWVIENGQVRRLIDMSGFQGSPQEAVQRCGRFNSYAGKTSSSDTVEENCPPCNDAAHIDFPACQVAG